MGKVKGLGKHGAKPHTPFTIIKELVHPRKITQALFIENIQKGKRSRAILNHGGKAPIPPLLGHGNGAVRGERPCGGHKMGRAFAL